MYYFIYLIDTGKLISPLTPTEKDNIYWGYTTRYCKTFQDIYDYCPYNKYDYILATSKHSDKSILDKDFNIPSYEHLLLIFGGTEGLYDILSPIPTWINNIINICPNQGSNIIKTEEAITILLSSIQNKLPLNL